MYSSYFAKIGIPLVCARAREYIANAKKGNARSLKDSLACATIFAICVCVCVCTNGGLCSCGYIRKRASGRVWRHTGCRDDGEEVEKKEEKEREREAGISSARGIPSTAFGSTKLRGQRFAEVRCTLDTFAFSPR